MSARPPVERSEHASDWTPPPGRPDWMFGTGATTGERALVWGTALVAAAVLWAWQASSGPAWSWWQHVLAAVLVIDVAGGVVANSLGSAKRLYHGPDPAGLGRGGRLARNHLVFTAAHVHPIVAGLAFDAAAWWGPAWWATTVAGVAVVGAVPLHLARPVAFAVATLAVVATVAMAGPAGMGWLGPALVLKLVVAHAVPEHPWRPEAAFPTRPTPEGAQP